MSRSAAHLMTALFKALGPVVEPETSYGQGDLHFGGAQATEGAAKTGSVGAEPVFLRY